MPHQIKTWHLLPAIYGSMSIRRIVLMSNEYVKWSTSHLNLFSSLQHGACMQIEPMHNNSHFTNLWLQCSLKWDFPYSTTLCWLRCRLTFSLLHSAIQAINRGSRSSQGRAVRSPTAIDLNNAENNTTDDLHVNLFNPILFFLYLHIYLYMHCITANLYM